MLHFIESGGVVSFGKSFSHGCVSW